MNTYKVPIKNVLYMYSYIWDRNRTEDLVNLNAEDDFNFSDLLADLFLRYGKKVLKHGMAKEYIVQDDEIAAVRGKINYGNTIFKQSLNKGKVYCEYDEFDENILINQIVKNAAIRLYRANNLSEDNRKKIRLFLNILSDVDFVEIDKKSFSKICLNRNNDYYFLLLKICELIINSSMLDSNNGEYRFYNIFDDDEQMHNVFELFVYKFYDYELSREYKVSFQKQLRFNVDSDEDLLLPVMRMDTTVETKEKVMIIDTKYYKEYMHKGLTGDKLISDNIYQMLSYLNNINTSKNKLVGVLLYPKPFDMDDINKTYKIDVTSNGRIQQADLKFVTIDLSKDWKIIRNNLLEMIR